MAGELEVAAEVAEAEFADEDHVDVAEFGWVGGEVPGFDDTISHLDLLEVADAADFGLVLRHAAACA